MIKASEIPRDWPRAKASETPSILTAIAKLLQIFDAYDKRIQVLKSSNRSPRRTLYHMIQKLKSYLME